jgi:hypothetical protein
MLGGALWPHHLGYKMIIKNEVRVCAMQRSGHNAIKFWIYNGFPDPRIGINHCNLVQGRSATSSNFKPLNQLFADLEEDLNLLIYNFEQVNIAKLQERRLLDPQAFHVWPAATKLKAKRQMIILVVRDPYNWIASCLKKKNLTHCKNSIPLYKEHLRQALGQVNHFGNYPHIVINYNRWFLEEEYRTELAQQIGFESQGQWNVVSGAGQGSSFDGLSFQGRAGEMGVLDRYRKYLANPKYMKLLKDKELVGLAEQYFGFNPL